MWDQLDAKQNVGKSLCGFVAMWFLCSLPWKMQALKLCIAIWKIFVSVQCLFQYNGKGNSKCNYSDTKWST